MSSKRGGNLGHADLPQERVIFHLDDGSIVDGNITIPRRGMRMSDFLTGSSREFINVSAATLTHPDDRSEYSPFIMIARKSIRMIKPGPRDEAEAQKDLWEARPESGVLPAIPPGTEPTAEAEDDDSGRSKSGIYPPKVPAVHLNRPPSGVHQIPDELKPKKKPR